MSENRNRIPLEEENLGGVSGGVNVPDWAKEERFHICPECGSEGELVVLNITNNGIRHATYYMSFACKKSHYWSMLVDH